MRIGSGFDVHAFGPGDHLILGGVQIPFHHGFKAHSDGDVLIHAICDAMLGALALGDIGHLFPPDEDKWRDQNSEFFLVYINDLINEKGFKIANIDSTIICEKPKIKPHIDAIQKNLAQVLKTETSQISVKATTTEKLGFCGRQEGVAVQVVCLLQSI